MKKFCMGLLAAPLFMLLSGCSSDTGAYLPKNTTKNNQETTAKFVLLDPGAQKSVTCSGLQEGRTPDGRLAVSANIRNRENRRIEVQVNCVFKDEQNYTVDETPFETLILTENETRGVRFEAMNPQAKNYTIRIRQAR